MAHRRVLVDTSIIIDFLRKQNKKKSYLWRIKENNTCFMSSVTLFELLAGAKTERHFDDIKRITKWIESICFDDDIAKIASEILKELRAKNDIIDFRDIFIGATAKCYNLHIATLNTGHFQRVSDLSVIDINEISE